MPGILPMKLIRTGSHNQTRVAQACDRCRSKKIRCDGVRPSCTQCANVGFECKTSDKLSRRAFPRGYTESLEERVRGLEAEVKELKGLLDAKEEQIEMLSRIHSFSPYSPPSSTSGRMNSTSSYKRPSEYTPPPEDSAADDRFIMPESSTLVIHEKSGDVFVGASSGRAFIDVLKKKMEATGLKKVNISSDVFFAKDERDGGYKSSSSQHKKSIKPPPRMISDLLVTAFFQEYHPLFPILHRPTFLGLYGNLVDQEISSPNYPRQDHEIAQLFLVFAIASSQTEARNSAEHEMFNRQWQKALEDLISRPTFNTLQCLLLAMLYCVSVGDYTKLIHYRGLAVSLAMRLGLNICQKNFELSALKSEMRKRVFWSLYCLDSFTAAMLGISTLIRDEEVDIDYPADIDDEYVSENGFLPSLPGEHSKISASIALFRASRMLSKVLATVYTQSSTQKQSFKKLQELEDELDSWKAGLAPHLRLEFVNGMPATNIIHSRSPLLVLAYHYIRVLIHRPTIGSENTKESGGSIYALVESSKCIYQILKLLEERKLGFSFCVNKNHTLLMCGFAVMYGSIGCSQEGAIVKDSQKIISGILGTLEGAKYPLVQNLREIASAFVKEVSPATSPKSNARSSLSPKVHAAISNGIEHIRRASSFSGGNSPHASRRKMSTKSNVSDATPIRRLGSSGFANANSSRASLPPLEAAQLAMLEQCGPRASFVSDNYIGNMDMLTWANGTDSLPTPSTLRPSPPTSAVSSEDWEQLVAAVDQNHGASIYGGMSSADIGLNLMTSTFKSTNSSASTLTTPAAVSPQTSKTVPTPSPMNDNTDLNNDNGGMGISIPWSSDTWNMSQEIHPTASSVSSFSNLSEEEAANLFDNENATGYIPNFLGLGAGLDCDWL